MDPELAEALHAASHRLGDLRAVVLPDLFVDHMIPVESMSQLQSGLQRVLAQGGGNVLLPGQRLKLGGNAANTAHALARLGVPTTLVCQSDGVGRLLWENATKGLPADHQGVMEVPHPSTTVALEVAEESANLMLSDPGPLARLHPKDLDERVWSWIQQADLVAVTNWAQTLEHGTRLLADVVRHAKKADTFSFLDTGDPAHRGASARALLDEKEIFEGLDAWGLNGHEARFFAGFLLDEDPGRIDLDAAAAALGRHTAGRIDIHSHQDAITIEHDETVRVPAFPVDPQHRTGAGDAWNAGNLTGTLLGLDPVHRLTLAHATATLTLTGNTSGPPRMKHVIAWLKED